MTNNILFWENAYKEEDGKYYGSIIPAEEVYNGVPVFNYTVRVWGTVPGNKEVELPKLITWNGEQYDSLNDMDWEERGAYLDSLVGATGEDHTDTYIEAMNVLGFDYENREFGSLSDDFITEKCHDYFKASNLTTVTADESITEYNFKIIDGYTLDYLEKPGNTNFEFGGMGNHATLEKVREEDGQEYLLMHQWSQWQGSELDTGYLLTIDEALDELVDHPEIDEIREWLEK